MNLFSPAIAVLLISIPLYSEPIPLAGELVKLAEKVTIDGVLSEDCWKNAKEWKVDYIMGKKGTLSAEPRMTVKYAWDDFFLYIGYEVNDANLISVSEGRLDGPKENQRVVAGIWKPGVNVDVVEFFITFGDQQFFWELHHNAQNQLGDVLILRGHDYWKKTTSSIARYGIYFAHGEDVQDEGPYEIPDPKSTEAEPIIETKVYRLKTAVHLKPKADGTPSTPNDETDVDTGYSAELRLPLMGLGVPLKKQLRKEHPPLEEGGRKIFEGVGWNLDALEVSILAVYQNGDIKDRYHHSSPDYAGGWFHNGVPAYPRFLMKAK